MDAHKTRHLLLGTIAGLIAGFLLFDKTGENQRLMAERDRVRAQLGELSSSHLRARSYVRQVNRPTSPRDSPARQTPSRDGTGLPFEITEEDKSLMEALEVRRRNGEYINKFEDPVTRKMLQHRIANGVEALAAKNRTNLAPVFARLGLSDEVSEQLQAHVSKINEAAMEARSSLDQLLSARWAYDQHVRSLLSPAVYEQYRQYEASGPARQEYENIRIFAEQQGIPVSEDERESLVGTIQEAQAYPKQSYLGPYDGLPPVAVGKENVLQNAEKRLAEVQEGANRALQLAAELDLSEASRNLLFGYYNQNVQKRSDEIAFIRDPLTEQRIQADAQRRVQEDMERAQQELAQKQAQKSKSR